MNISQMMRSFLGEASASDTRSVELKAGQIVRGVVLQVMENNEAFVQINGIQVRAKLESRMHTGQSAMLQVQPNKNGGALVTLRLIEPGDVGLPEDTFKEWARQLALPEQKWAVDIVKDLRKEGVILNREVAKAFQQAAALMPSGPVAEQWMRASAAVFKRGLPMTPAAIGALHQVMFGRGTHELLDTLQKQLASMTDNIAGGKEKAVTQAAERLKSLLDEGAELLRTAFKAAEASNANGGSGKMRGAAAGAGAQVFIPAGTPNAAADRAPEPGVLRAFPAQGKAENEGTQQSPLIGDSKSSEPVEAEANWIGKMMKWLGVEHEHQLLKIPQSTTPSRTEGGQESGQVAGGESATGRSPGGPSSAAAGTGAGSLPADIGNAASPAGAAAHVPASSAETGEQPLSRPAEHRNERLQADAAFQPPAVIDHLREPDPAGSARQESLKSALLSLIAAEDTPPALKDTAQQLVQQITGQQLLLTPERNNSMLTHVTLFIPLRSQDGDQSATVHIQTRRGRKGELDADNCRLLFNLSMRTLGETMVDVHVTDKIVSLNLWNDHPAIAALAESSRHEISASLQQAGYQLLSLRTTPLQRPGEQAAEPAAGSAAQQPPELSDFASSRYKGVDFRI